jgi:phosphatidylinositol-3-phosphatase
VFTIVLENESASVTFGAGTKAPYLAQTLASEGAYLPHYYGTGHASLDNYIAMISGQAPTTNTDADCGTYSDFSGTLGIGAYGQELGEGCVYPSDIQNIATQLDTAGYSWRDYDEDMGADPSRESSTCGHPVIGTADDTQVETPTDGYASRHDPFIYFHSIIDNTALCDSHVVNLSDLPTDLSSAATTPDYVFITPNLCDDGHNAPCANGQPGGLTEVNTWLQKWVPLITNSPAFKEQNGLLMIIFDEATGGDDSSCCGEIPGPGNPLPGGGGPGGGDTGAVFLSPCIKPGTVDQTAYNHYTMLGSVENLFELPHLGYANLPGETYFGSDVFTQSCSSPPTVTLKAPALLSSAGTSQSALVKWSSPVRGTKFDLQVQQTSGTTPSAWTTLVSDGSQTQASYRTGLGQTYSFRLMASPATGPSTLWMPATVVSPSGPRPAGVSLHGHWRSVKEKGAWTGSALTGTRRGSKYTYNYTGGSISVIGSRGPTGGSATFTIDGHSTKVQLHSGGLRVRQVLFHSGTLTAGPHKLTITVDGGSVAVEGLAVTNLS